MNRTIFNELSGQNETYSFIKELKTMGNGKLFLYFFGEMLVIISELSKALDNESQSEIEKELYSYDRLKKLSLNIPKLLGYNKDENIIIKEYIEGQNVMNLLENDLLSHEVYMLLLKYSERVNSDNLNIDYFPSNFILKDNKLFYINYKTVPYSDELNLRNWGIYYWINSMAIKNYVENKDEKTSNIEGEKSPIITDELIAKRDKLFLDYVDSKYNGMY